METEAPHYKKKKNKKKVTQAFIFELFTVFLNCWIRFVGEQPLTHVFYAFLLENTFFSMWAYAFGIIKTWFIKPQEVIRRSSAAKHCYCGPHWFIYFKTYIDNDDIQSFLSFVASAFFWQKFGVKQLCTEAVPLKWHLCIIFTHKSL